MNLRAHRPLLDRSLAALAALAGLLAVVAFAGCSHEATTPPSTDELGRALDPLFERWNRSDSPGVAVVVLKDGEPVYRRAVGVESLDSGTPVTVDGTVFDLASVSKHMTAYAIHRLEERGALSLDDEVRHHLPWFPDFGTSVTLRHLLHHTSGLREYLDLVTWNRSREGPFSQAELRSWVEQQEDLNFPPGSQHMYSNTGYLVLAEVVAEVSGRSFAEFLQDEMFQPLGLEETTVRDPDAPPRATESYGPRQGPLTWLRGPFEPARDGLESWGDGGIDSTAENLARWLDHLRVTLAEGGPMAEMGRRGRTLGGSEFAYASGLRPETMHGVDLLWHGGSNAGFRSWAGFAPEAGWTLVLLSNSHPGAGGLGPEVLRILVNHEGSGETQPTPLDVTAPPPGSDSSRWVGHFTDGTFGARISLENGALVYRSPGGPRPARPGNGELHVGSRRLGADLDPSGTLRALRFWYGAQEVTMERYQPVDPSTVDWEAVVGQYHSGELGVTLHLRVAEGLLEAELPVRTDRYFPARPDHFLIDSGRASSITVSRDAAGAIDGLWLDLIRARRLRFERLQPTS